MTQPKLILTIGIGQQEIEIYALRDFEKCTYCAKCCSNCDYTGYKIVFKDYGIKKISEIITNKIKLYRKMVEHNLKEDDKIVVVRK